MKVVNGTFARQDHAVCVISYFLTMMLCLKFVLFKTRHLRTYSGEEPFESLLQLESVKSAQKEWVG